MTFFSNVSAQRQPSQLGQMTSGNASSSRSQSGNSSSRSQSSGSDEEDPCVPLNDARTCWTIDPLTGIIHYTIPDTTYLDLARIDAMEARALSLVYTGNLFSPHQVEYFFDRRQPHDYLFANAYQLFNQRPEDIEFYRTKIPFTVAAYSKSGANLQENDHLKLRFAGNFNQQIGLGTSLDYVYARGEYFNQATKPLNWTSYGYYEDDVYKAYLTFTVQKLANQENGGVGDRNLVLNPDSYKGSALTEPRTMETLLSNTWNDTRQKQVHFTHNYNFGRWEERRDPNDSTNIWDELVPIGTIFHTVDLEHYDHNFRMDAGGEMTDKPFFGNHFYNPKETNDSTALLHFSTYLGVKLNEGFSKFSQFAISAFAGFERYNYTVLDSIGVCTNKLDSVGSRRHGENNFWIGGQLSRQLSSALTLDVMARYCLPGSDDANDFELTGNVSTCIPFGQTVVLDTDTLTGNITYGKTDSLIIKANGFVRNANVSYLMERYYSNHFRWDNPGFKSEKRVRIEGSIFYPRTQTTVRGGIEHIANYHYFGKDFMPTQYDNPLEVYSLELDQKLALGPLHWDNRILFQKSLKKEVLPLPALTIETDMNIRFRIARVLWTQLGVMGNYHTRYYAPTYQPATQQFALQDDVECGGFPVLNAYMNCNLKRIKFFISMYNFLDKSVTNDIFIMRDYPMLPRRFEWGVTLDLQN